MSKQKPPAFEGKLILLADGTLGVRLPLGWRLGDESFSTATFLHDSIEYASLQVEITSFEDPKAVNEDDFSRFLEDDANRLCESSGLSGSTGFIIKGSAADTDDGSHRQIWRVIKSLFPDHVRIATYTLNMPLSQAATDSSHTLTTAVDGIVESSAFAGALTALDQIAPTKNMKRISFWNTIHMRVPADWQFSRATHEGSGMYCGEPQNEAEQGNEAFWVDYDEFRRQGDVGALDPTTQRKVIDELASNVAAQAENKDRDVKLEFLGNGDGLLSYQYEKRQNGETLRVYRWFRFASQPRSMIMSMFGFVVTEDMVEEREIADRAALLGREIRNAVIGSPTAQTVPE